MKKPQAKRPSPKPKPEPSMAEVAAAQPKLGPSADERKYRAEDSLRCLQRAEEIKADKGLMADIHAHAHKQMATIAKATGRGKPRGKPRGEPQGKPT